MDLRLEHRLLILGLSILLSHQAHATINSDVAKSLDLHTPRIQKTKAVQKNKKKKRKLYINFKDQNRMEDQSQSEMEVKNDAFQSSEEVHSYSDPRSNIKLRSATKGQTLARSSETMKPKAPKATFANAFSLERKSGITNQLLLGYSNSAYRYDGEDFPTKSVDFIWAPLYSTTCFSVRCIYNGRFTGGLDLNNKNKNEFGLLQFGLRFAPEPWGGYFTPDFGLRGFLPATPKEINDDYMVFGYGAAFSLSTTESLLGTDFIMFTAAFSARKDVFEVTLPTQRNWMGREALLIDFKFTNSLFSTLLFGHIFNELNDKSNKDALELIQSVTWRYNDWLSLVVSHSNTKPTYMGDSSQIDTRMVTPDQSVISFGTLITNSF